MIATAVRPLVVLLLLLLPSAVMAQTVPIAVDGLRGGRHVGSAAAAPSGPRLVAGLGYGYTEAVLGQGDRHHRGFGSLAVGYAPRPYLQLSLAFDGRYDVHRADGSANDDSGAAFATGLTTRHAFTLAEGLSLAPQLRLRFPAATSVVRGLSALSPELSLLVTKLFARRYELTALAGYRFDRSLESVDVESLSRADRLGATVSRFDAVLLGALFALPIGPLVASAEWSFDLATGAASPPAKASPMRVRLGAQMPFGRYLPGVELGISPSARPSLDVLARIEPRLWIAATLSVSFEPPAPPPRVVTPSEPVLPPAQPVSVALRVVDATGAPIERATLTLGDGAESEQKVTNAEGTALLLLEETPRALVVEAEGFERHEGEISRASEPEARTIRLTRALPEGEIQGKVRSLRGGRPLHARVVVQPLGTAVETDAEGNFKLTVPPGSYQLEINADGHERQQRPAQVERLGVTIVVVDLRRVAK